MNNLVRLLSFFCALALNLYATGVEAAPTVEQLKRVIERSGVPPWKQAIEQAKVLRTNTPNSNSSATWLALDAENEKAAFARVTNPRDGNDLSILSMWLRWKILSENADGRYSYAYAANLNYMLDQNGLPLYAKEAVIFFFHARISIAIDGARCKDQASPESVVYGYETQPYIQPLIEKVSKMSKRDKAFAMLEAVTLEQLRSERPLLDGLCTRGAATALKALAAGRQPMEQNQNSSASQKLPGKTYAIDTSGIEPDLYSIEEWKVKRRQILDRFIQSAAESL